MYELCLGVIHACMQTPQYKIVLTGLLNTIADLFYNYNYLLILKSREYGFLLGFVFHQLSSKIPAMAGASITNLPAM